MTKFYVVLEKDEDGMPDVWDTAFATFQEAASAIEARHAELWGEAEMPDDFPELEIYREGNGATFGLFDESWRSWYINEVEVKDE